MPKDLQYYLSLAYTKVVRRDEDGDYVAEIKELDGCIAHGSTEVEALQILDEAKKAWIEDCIAAHQSVPEPVEEEVLPSGRWLQRVPRSLHQKLTELAEQEDTSLNQLVTSILSEAVGIRKRPTEESGQHRRATHPKRERWHGWYREAAVSFEAPWEISQAPTQHKRVVRGHAELLRRKLPDQFISSLKVEEDAEEQEKAHRA